MIQLDDYPMIDSMARRWARYSPETRSALNQAFDYAIRNPAMVSGYHSRVYLRRGLRIEIHRFRHRGMRFALRIAGRRPAVILIAQYGRPDRAALLSRAMPCV